MIIKKFYIFALVLFLIGCSSSGIIVKRYDESDILHFSQMKNDKDLVNKVVYLNKGDKIPVEIQVDSNVLDVEDKSVNLVLKKRIYFRLVIPDGVALTDLEKMPENKKKQILEQSMIYLSSDGLKWARYTEFKVVKKLFGIDGGSFSMSFGITKKHGPKLSLLGFTRNAK